MATVTKKYWIGSRGPYLYKTSDPNSSPLRIETFAGSGQKNVSTAPAGTTINEDRDITAAFGRVSPTMYSAYRAAHFFSFNGQTP